MSEAFSALAASIIRTVVPAIVGATLGWLAALNLPVDPGFEGVLGTALTTLFTGIYYAGVRALETYVTPKFGWLLGLAKAPVVYSSVKPADIKPTLDAATGAVEIAAAQVVSTDTPESGESTPAHPSVG